MKYIDNDELRMWVQENLQRKLIRNAHDLAVQTGCEVLLRLQGEDCKYYVTEGLKSEYLNHGVRLSPGDQPMSGESGLPEKNMHDFTCQFSSDVERDQQAPILTRHPREQDVQQNEEITRLYRERLWIQQHQHQQQTASVDAQMESVLQREVERQWPRGNGVRRPLRHTVIPASSDAALPTSGAHQTQPPAMEADDMALRNLKQLHLQRLVRPNGEHLTARSVREYVAVMQQIDMDHANMIVAAQDGSQKPGEMLISPRQETPTHTLPPPPPLSSPHTQQQLQRPHQQVHSTDTANVPNQEMRVMVNDAGFESQSMPSTGSTQQRYLCRICERTFCDLYTLVSHAKMFHSSMLELIFVCNTCKTPFEDARSIHDHLKFHGDLGFYNGAACELKGPSGQVRQRIVQQRRFPCPECGKMFSRFGFMQSHIERIHGGSHISSSMDTTALSKDTVIQQSELPADKAPDDQGTETAPPEQRFQCDDCKEWFNNTEVFEQHIKDMHLCRDSSVSAPPSITNNTEIPIQRLRSKSEDLTAAGKEVFECQECGQQFSRGKLLQNHVNTYHISGNCNLGDQLNSATIREPELVAHEPSKEASVTGDSDVKTLTVGYERVLKTEPEHEILDLSTKSTMSDASLPGSDMSSDDPNSPSDDLQPDEINQDTDSAKDPRTRRKRYVCDVCGKSYKYGFHMKEHRLTHAAVCPFVCRLCGMGFFRQRQLRDHELRHTGAYPCRCDICGKGFPRTSELKRHLAFRHRRMDIFTRQASLPVPSAVQS